MLHLDDSRFRMARRATWLGNRHGDGATFKRESRRWPERFDLRLQLSAYLQGLERSGTAAMEGFGLEERAPRARKGSDLHERELRLFQSSRCDPIKPTSEVCSSP